MAHAVCGDDALAKIICDSLTDYRLPLDLLHGLAVFDALPWKPTPSNSFESSVRQGLRNEVRQGFPDASDNVVEIMAMTFSMACVTQAILQNAERDFGLNALLLMLNRAYKGGGEKGLEEKIKLIYAPVIKRVQPRVASYLASPPNSKMPNLEQYPLKTPAPSMVPRQKTHVECVRELLSIIETFSLLDSVQHKLLEVDSLFDELADGVWDVWVASGEQHLAAALQTELMDTYENCSTQFVVEVLYILLAPEVLDALVDSLSTTTRAGVIEVLFHEIQRIDGQESARKLAKEIFGSLFEPLCRIKLNDQPMPGPEGPKRHDGVDLLRAFVSRVAPLCASEQDLHLNHN